MNDDVDLFGKGGIYLDIYRTLELDRYLIYPLSILPGLECCAAHLKTLATGFQLLV